MSAEQAETADWRDELIMGGPILPDGRHHPCGDGLSLVRQCVRDQQEKARGVIWPAIVDVLDALEADRDRWKTEAQRVSRRFDETRRFEVGELEDARREVVSLQVRVLELEAQATREDRR